jgi:hypothetical protein
MTNWNLFEVINRAKEERPAVRAGLKHGEPFTID